MHQSGRLTLALLLLAGCARAATPSPPVVSPEARIGDPALYRILGTVPLDSAAEQALQRYELDHPVSFLEELADVAADPAAGTPARYHAVMLLGQRQAGQYVNALAAALSDPDPRVRAAAVVAAGKILDASGSTGKSLAVAALEDSAPEVQAKALEVLGTRDLPLLRDFLLHHPDGEVAIIARGLVQSAEQRGAPVLADSAGVLRRATVGGLKLEFTPTERWPEWDAALGTVRITGEPSLMVTIPDIEVVAGVVPVFFSPDEGAIVYEQNRHVFVRDLASGATRDLGSGIAPRPLPFSDDFVFLRLEPARSGDLNGRMRLSYDVLSSSFRDATPPQLLGQLGAFADMTQHGNYSPARWLRVVERNGQYTLEAAGADTFRLPDPFQRGSHP